MSSQSSARRPPFSSPDTSWCFTESDWCRTLQKGNGSQLSRSQLPPASTRQRPRENMQQRPQLLEGPESAEEATPVGFEPTRGDPIGLAGRRLNRSAKVSCACAPRKPQLLLRHPFGLVSAPQWGADGPRLWLMRAPPAPPPPAQRCSATAKYPYPTFAFAPFSSFPCRGCSTNTENDTCGIRTHAGRPHRLSRPTP